MDLRFYRDPKLARTLSRSSWVVLVAAFVLLTRFDAGPAEPWALLGLVALMLTLNAPVMYGLSVSRADSGTRAYRAVAVLLLLRLGATGFVVWAVSEA